MEEKQEDSYEFFGENPEEEETSDNENETSNNEFSEEYEDYLDPDKVEVSNSYITIPYMGMAEYTVLLCDIANAIRSSALSLSKEELELVYGNGTDICMAYNIVKYRTRMEKFPFYIKRGRVKMDPRKMLTPLELETKDLNSEEPSVYEEFFTVK